LLFHNSFWKYSSAAGEGGGTHRSFSLVWPTTIASGGGGVPVEILALLYGLALASAGVELYKSNGRTALTLLSWLQVLGRRLTSRKKHKLLLFKLITKVSPPDSE
jgi:hypothetical protein